MQHGWGRPAPWNNPTRRQFLSAVAAAAAGLALGAGWGAPGTGWGAPGTGWGAPGRTGDESGPAAAPLWLAPGRPLVRPPARDPDTGLWEVAAARPGLGTLLSVAALHPDPVAGAAAVDAALAEADRLEGLLSAYRPGTPMWRLNRDGALAQPPPELAAVLEQSLGEAARSGGAFDPTVAPVLALYAASARQGRVPAERELAAARELVGYGRVRVAAGDPGGPAAVYLDRPGMALTINAAGKGYVVDAMVRRLRAAGVTGALVFAGGDLFALGRRGRHRWRVGVLDPGGGLAAVLEPEDAGVATGGDYRTAFGPGLHHILDPRRGAPPPDVRSVTALAPTAAAAGALATAAFALGPEAGRAYLASHGEGLMLRRGAGPWQTSGLPVAS